MIKGDKSKCALLLIASSYPPCVKFNKIQYIFSKCDLDLGDIDVILSRNTPSNDGEKMCQMILKSHNERHSYGPGKLIYGHF